MKLTLHVVSNRGRRRTRSLTMMTVNKFIEIFMNSDFMYRTHLYHAMLEGKLSQKRLLEYDYIRRCHLMVTNWWNHLNFISKTLRHEFKDAFSSP